MRRSTALSCLVAVALVLTACADYVGDDIRAVDASGPDLVVPFAALEPPDDPPEPPEPVEPATLEVGECFDDPEESDLVAFPRGQTVGRLPCAQPHRYEVYARFPSAESGGTWPGAAVLEESADRECTEAFEEFTGTPWTESSLDFVVLAPTEERWAAGDGTVTCALFDLGLVPLVGSMRDAQR